MQLRLYEPLETLPVPGKSNPCSYYNHSKDSRGLIGVGTCPIKIAAFWDAIVGGRAAVGAVFSAEIVNIRRVGVVVIVRVVAVAACSRACSIRGAAPGCAVPCV